DLRKDFIHNPRCEEDLLVWDGRVLSAQNTFVKLRDELFHPKIMVQPALKERSNVPEPIAYMFPGIHERSDDIGQITFELPSFLSNDAARHVIDYQRVHRAANSKPIQTGLDLAGKTKESSRSFSITD